MNEMSFTYRGLRKFNLLDISTNWDSVDEYYWNPHSRCYECLYNGRHITLSPDLVGFQDGRIHVVYKSGPDEAWLECLPALRNSYLDWSLIARSGEIRKEMVANWHGYTEAPHPNLRWLWGDFDCLPKALLVLVVAAVIKCAGYKGKGMFLHEINPAVIREDWMYPYISIPAGMSNEEEEKIHDCFDRCRKEA